MLATLDSGMHRFMHQHLISTDNLMPDDITTLLDLADHYVVQNRRQSQTHTLLQNIVIVNLFLENSTRTRLSFEMAGKRLGAQIINMSADGSSVQKGEHLIDTLQTINAMRPDMLVIREAADDAALMAAESLSCPVINAGSGMRQHPTQALLDALTLRRHFGHLEGLKILICGDIKHSRVARSNLDLLQKMGAFVTVTGPSELLPEDLLNTTTDFDAALADIDAVMMLRIQKERLAKTLSFSEDIYFKTWGLTARRLEKMPPHAVVLHPGPMNRGVEIDSAVADHPRRSLITTQVEMGVATRMACLDILTRYKR